MTKLELAADRTRRGLTQEAYGAHLASLLQVARAYTRQEVNAWECGRRAVPASVAAAIWRERALSAEKALALAMSRIARMEPVAMRKTA